jgi:UV excision repair protein RAD23
MLEPILQQVGAGNPGLARIIGENPDQFLQLLSEDADEDTPLPPGATSVPVTEEEREAIERVSVEKGKTMNEANYCSYVALVSNVI